MRKIGKICTLVVVVMLVSIMIAPAVSAPPGQGGNPPGQGGTPPGQGGAPPGISGVTGWTVNGTTVYKTDLEGNVGIGTTNPSGKLEVVGDIVVNGTVDGVDIDVEAAARLATDIALQNGLDAEEAARIAADIALQNNIDAEEAARIAADVLLQNNIDAEEAARTAADIALQNNIDVEQAARIAADVLLQNNIDDEETARIAADDQLQANIDTEEAARIDADSDLQVQIDDLEEQTVNQLIQDFEVAPGESVSAGDVVRYLNEQVQKCRGNTINFGSEHVFNSDPTHYTSAAVLTSDKFVVAYTCYDLVGSNYYSAAVIGDVSGSTITFGPEYVFNSDYTREISAIALSLDKFVVAYVDPAHSYHGTAVIGEVSGSTISFGSECVFNSDWTEYISAAALTSDKFVVTYTDGGDWYGRARIGEISGSTITFGSEHVIDSSVWAAYTSVVALSSDKFVVAYMAGPFQCYGKARIGEMSGSTITFGSEHYFNYGETWYTSTAALSSDKFVVAYIDYDNSKYGTAVIGEVLGSTITFGSEHVFNFNTGYIWSLDLSVAALSSDKFVVAYYDGGNSGYGTAVIGDVSGSTITFGPEHVFNSDESYYISVAALSSDKFVVTYDLGNSCYGTARIGEIPLVPPGSHIVGIAKENKTEGETVHVIVDGVSDVHSGLTPGEIYYLDNSSRLTTTVTSRKIGLAISSTEILMATPYF